LLDWHQKLEKWGETLGAEEHFLEAIDEEEEEEIEALDRRTTRHERLESKNKTAIDGFLGKRKSA